MRSGATTTTAVVGPTVNGSAMDPRATATISQTAPGPALGLMEGTGTTKRAPRHSGRPARRRRTPATMAAVASGVRAIVAATETVTLVATARSWTAATARPPSLSSAVVAGEGADQRERRHRVPGIV